MEKKEKEKTTGNKNEGAGLFKLLLQVVGGGGRGRVRILGERRHGNHPGRAEDLVVTRVLHVLCGDDGEGCAPLLVLVGLDVLREVVASHKPLGTFRTLKPLLTYQET